MLRKKYRAAVIIMAATPMAAQSTGTPVFQAPYRAFSNSELGISLSDPGVGFALEGSYRGILASRTDGGLRIGITEPGHRGSTGILLGVDGRYRLIDHTQAFPLDGALILGVGVHTIHGHTTGYFPIGLTMGRRVLFEQSSVSFVPYIQPTLTPLFGDSRGSLFSIGFGVDVRVNPRLDLRFSAGIGDQDGIAFTAAFLR